MRRDLDYRREDLCLTNDSSSVSFFETAILQITQKLVLLVVFWHN